MTDSHKKRPDSPPRKIRNVTTAADKEALRNNYTFIPESGSSSRDTWQKRMVHHYHSHLYREYVLADLRHPGKVGLRWRTQPEVQRGRGHRTCGNKHCPASEQVPDSSGDASLLSSYYQSVPPALAGEEKKLLQTLPHGLGLHDYEVPFTYQEQGEAKTELVKLRLCLRCAPQLFASRGGEGLLEARRARGSRRNDEAEKIASLRRSTSKQQKCEDSDGGGGEGRPPRKRKRLKNDQE